MINTLIAFAVTAWIVQMLLGGWQMYCFNRALERLSKLGKVGIGRSGGGFSPRVLIAIAVNEQEQIVGSLLMKGVTVFVQPAPVLALHCCYLKEIEPELIFPCDKKCQNALSLALNVTV
ncbi:MAG: transcriptional regulator GutM [Enterobacteriaceae bacterium]